MGQVSVKINGYAYVVACEDGQESHLHAMALQVERRIERVKDVIGQSGEGRMLVLAALLMADELHDLSAEKLPSEMTMTLAESEKARKENARRKEQLSLLIERAEAIADSLEEH